MTTTDSVVSKRPDSHRRAGLLRVLFSRTTLQLIGSSAVAVCLPFLVRMLAGGLAWTNPVLQHTALAACAAIVIGFCIYRRSASLSETQALKHILVSLTSTFGIALLMLSFVKIEFDGYQLAMSYLLSTGWCIGLLLSIGHIQPRRFLLVPGPGTQSLPAIPGADWQMLRSPVPRRDTCTGVVADIFADQDDQWARYVKAMTRAGIPVFDSRQVREALTGQVDIDQVCENPFTSPIANPSYSEIKLAADWLVAFIALTLLSPVLLAIAIFIRMDSPGPVLCRRDCMGHRGKRFKLFTFRTTIDRLGGGDIRNDAEFGFRRPTKVGTFLQRYRIDRLPQLLNIVRGEMSWIGPSAETVLAFESHQKSLPLYRYRLIVRPGISGWAGVNQKHLAQSNGTHQKLCNDFYYIKYHSLWLDALIGLRVAGSLLNEMSARRR